MIVCILYLIYHFVNFLVDFIKLLQSNLNDLLCVYLDNHPIIVIK